MDDPYRTPPPVGKPQREKPAKSLGDQIYDSSLVALLVGFHLFSGMAVDRLDDRGIGRVGATHHWLLTRIQTLRR